MKKIMRFEPVSVMRISAITYGVLGLLEGAIVSVFLSTVPFAAPNSSNLPRVLGPVFGVLAIIFLPLIFAAMGAITGGLGAVIYNVAAKYVGGIQVEVE